MTTISTDQLPIRASIWADEATLLFGAALSAPTDQNQAYDFFSYQAVAAVGDKRTWGCWLRSGTYTVTILGITNNSYGIVDWYIDDVLAASGQDWYSVGVTYNVVKSFSVIITTDGWHTIRVHTTGKNVSSADEFFLATKLWFKTNNDLAVSAGLDGVTLFDFDFFPTRAELLFDEFNILTGNPTGRTINTTHIYGNWSNQTPSAADGDSFSHSMFLRAGTYTLAVLGVTTNTLGKIDWYIDGVLVVSGQDWYTLVLTVNVVKTATVTVVGDGRHSIVAKVNGKNASSTNFFAALTLAFLRMAAD